MVRMVSKDIVEKIVNKSLGGSVVRSIKPFSQGHINTMIEVTLMGTNKSLLLRIFNEPWKARKEAFVYNYIRENVDIPVPEIYAFDDSMKLVPGAYLLMSKIEGISIDKNYRKYRNKKIFEKAGEVLAKLHSIKFDKYGWIVDNEIKPSFSKWNKFFEYDIGLKLSALRKVKLVSGLLDDLQSFIERHDYLLKVKSKPCLLHKDYHCPHIITDKGTIKGIVDVEWALAGHNENDFMKMEEWAFRKFNDVREPFFKGYLNYGTVSEEYPERKKLYELWHWINMSNISFQLKDKRWLDYNTKALKKFLKVNSK